MAGADAVGEWREAVEEVQRFRAAGGLPNTVAYNALVRADAPKQKACGKAQALRCRCQHALQR